MTGVQTCALPILAAVVPVVDGLRHVDALVALQADELAAGPAAEHLGDLGLADARLALQQQRPAELEREAAMLISERFGFDVPVVVLPVPDVPVLVPAVVEAPIAPTPERPPTPGRRPRMKSASDGWLSRTGWTSDEIVAAVLIVQYIITIQFSTTVCPPTSSVSSRPSRPSRPAAARCRGATST